MFALPDAHRAGSNRQQSGCREHCKGENPSENAHHFSFRVPSFGRIPVHWVDSPIDVLRGLNVPAAPKYADPGRYVRATHQSSAGPISNMETLSSGSRSDARPKVELPSPALHETVLCRSSYVRKLRPLVPADNFP